jgi:hypothetical protein
MFYPVGNGNKVFSKLDPDLVDSLALAVWFLDDGSKTTSGARFSVGPDESSQRVQLKILHKFGLDARLYPTKGDPSIHICGRRSITRFIDLISPYFPSCMGYKLSFSKVRKAGLSPRDLLTPERVVTLAERGTSPQGIASIFGVSRGSVIRSLYRSGIHRNPSGRPKDKVQQLAIEEATSKLMQLRSDREGFLDGATKILLMTSFPLPKPSREEVAHDLELLRNCSTRLVGSEFSSVGQAGLLTCSKYFDYRLDARYRDQLSARQAWSDEDKIRSAIKFQLRLGGIVTPITVFQTLQRIIRASTNLEPSVAKAIVESFSSIGGLVFDPCAGYGERAVGTLSAGRRYIGVDPNRKAVEAFNGIFSEFDLEGKFFNCPIEEFEQPSLGADLVLTSPPLFSVERYSDDITQSWVRYPTWDLWVMGFLTPFVQKSKLHLKKGGVFCVNTQDIGVEEKFYPIATEVSRLAKESGFILERTLTISLSKALRSETLLVFRCN